LRHSLRLTLLVSHEVTNGS